MRRLWNYRAAAIPAALLLALLVGLLIPGGQSAAQKPPGSSEILLACGPGTVLTRDGTIWVYRPDRGEWLTIDKSFAESDGRKTKVLPLPVDPVDIADMASFGFIVTRAGSCWLYDLEKDQWREAGTPPRRP